MKFIHTSIVILYLKACPVVLFCKYLKALTIFLAGINKETIKYFLESLPLETCFLKAFSKTYKNGL